jgi:hypothetical protein
MYNNDVNKRRRDVYNFNAEEIFILVAVGSQFPCPCKTHASR